MTLSRFGDNVPCAFHESCAPGSTAPDCSVRSPASNVPCSVGHSITSPYGAGRGMVGHCDVRPQEVWSMLHLIAVGRLRAGPEAELFARYNARLRPHFTVAEVAEGRGAPAEVKRREGAALLAALPASAFVVVLDLGGDAP